MTNYKELADRLQEPGPGTAEFYEACDEAAEILRSLDAQEPVAWMHHQGSYKEPSLFELDNDELARGWAQSPLYAAPVAAQPQQASKPLSDADFAFNMLALMFDAYENGVTCYEDPEDEVGFIGYAYRLADDDFQNIATFLNRVRPVQPGIKERG